MKYYKDTIWLFVIIFLQQSVNAMLEKSINASFKTIETSIREKNIKAADTHLKNIFLSEKQCRDLIKIVAVEGDSEDHVEYIKKLYTHIGTLFIKKLNKEKLENSDNIIILDPYKTGEQIMAVYREKDQNKTDLAYALLHNHPAVFALLMEANNEKFLKKTGCNLAQSAVMLGRIEILKKLLTYKISIDCSIGIHDDSIWHTAAKIKGDNSIEIFNLLKEYYETTTQKKLDLSINNNNKETPLMVVCGLSCRYLIPDIVDYLLQQKSNPNDEDAYGDSPLHRATYWNCYKTVSLLLKANGNPNKKGNNKNTPLHTACYRLSEKSSEKLLKHKETHVNAQNNDGDTPLHILLKKTKLDEKEIDKQKNMLLTLTKNGAEWDVLNNEGIAQLHYFAEIPFLYKEKYRKQIENHTKDKNLDWSLEQGKTGNTLLHQFIQKRGISEKDYSATLDFIQFLLDRGVSPTQKNKKNETAIDLVTELLKTENASKNLKQYYTSINLLLTFKNALETGLKGTLSKKTLSSLRLSLKKE